MPGGSGTERLIGGRFGRWIGAALLLHFSFVLTVLVRKGAPGEVLWLSHVSLLLSGLGLMLRSTLLVASALTAVGTLHGCWLIDSLTGLTSGWFPIGATDYILTADGWTRIATSHHFYLAPLLLVIVWRYGQFPRSAFPLAAGLFLMLSTLCRIATPPDQNVNFAYHVAAATSLPLVVWANGLSPAAYLFVVNTFVIGTMFLPAVCLLRWCTRGPSGPSSCVTGRVGHSGPVALHESG